MAEPRTDLAAVELVVEAFGDAAARRDTDAMMKLGEALAVTVGGFARRLTDLVDVAASNRWTVIGFRDEGHPVILGAVPGHLTVTLADTGAVDEVFAHQVIAASAGDAVAAVRLLGAPS